MNPRTPLVERAGVALIASLARASRARLALVVLVQCVLWAQAPLVLVLRQPAWVAIALGVALTPLRSLAQQRLRTHLRTAAFARIAQRSLLRTRAGLSELEADAAFWSTHIAEFAVSTTLPTVVAASVTITLSFALLARSTELRAIVALCALLSAAALAIVLATRALSDRASRAIDARRMLSVWLAASLRGGGEIRGDRARAACVDRVELAARRWCDEDNAFELRRDLFRVSIVALALVAALVFAPDMVRSVREAIARDSTAAVAFAALLTAGFAATRALSDVMVTVSELRRLDVPVTAEGDEPPATRRLQARPNAVVGQRIVVRRGETLAFSADDLRIPLGGLVLISGPNGAGKTTLISSIAALLPLTEGELRFELENEQIACAAVAREQVLFVPQEPVMVAPLSVRENIAMLVPDASDDAMLAALARLGLSIALDRPVESLSRGQLHRVGIARALLAAPLVLLLDEPDAWLDGAARATLLHALEQESRERCVVVVSHRDDLLSVASAHFVVDGGRIRERHPAHSARA
ncbi:MAG: ATP-binding cassette domain-containing protein [Polyangiales bacterium]